MSTRGIFIIRKGGQDKALYIPSDAYPSYSAPNVISLIREADLDALFELLIPESFSHYYWFDARELMGRSLEKRKLMYKDDAEFIKDSLMCEYGYVINLDDEVLEYYVGFQNTPQEGNRYGEEVTFVSSSEKNYYPCKLVARFSFRYVKKMLVRNMVEIMEGDHLEADIKNYDVDDDENVSDNIEDKDLKPTLIMIYKKIEWIQNQISSTLDKHIDMESRYEQGLRDIDILKAEMMVHRMEIGRLQQDLEKNSKGIN